MRYSIPPTHPGSLDPQPFGLAAAKDRDDFRLAQLRSCCLCLNEAPERVLLIMAMGLRYSNATQ
jgi:hypothetical protein